MPGRVDVPTDEERRPLAGAHLGCALRPFHTARCTSTSGGWVRVLCTVQCEATASNACRLSSGTPSGSVRVIVTAQATSGAKPSRVASMTITLTLPDGVPED